LVGFEVFFAVAAFVGFADDAPVEQCPDGHGCVAAGDLEAVHDLVGVHWFAGDVEQRVGFGHGPADAPGTGHLAPRGDETILSFDEFFVLIILAGHRGIMRWSRCRVEWLFQNKLKQDLFGGIRG